MAHSRLSDFDVRCPLKIESSDDLD
jgi:hypothetical protein